jgi:hypothetical protein
MPSAVREVRSTHSILFTLQEESTNGGVKISTKILEKSLPSFLYISSYLITKLN